MEAENEAESGDGAIGFDVSNEGDYASRCVSGLQPGNTGNLNAAPTDLQDASEADDLIAGGSTFGVAPESAVGCARPSGRP